MHSHNLKAIDLCIPTMPGRGTSGFHRPERHQMHQARSAARRSASRMNGHLHPTKNRLWSGLSHRVRSFLCIAASKKLIRGECTHFRLSSSVKTEDPNVPRVSGRISSGFHWSSRQRVHQAQSAVRCLEVV